jgi:hypothetical protein
MNQTINSHQQSVQSEILTSRTQKITAKQFFSKDNQNHPTVEENKKLK